MIKKILMGLLVVIAAFVAFVVTRPAQYRVERSVVVAAPAEVVYAQVADFHNWAAWSPWEDLDPAMKKEFEGASMGVGAGYHWIGNDKVGEGRMTITDATPGERVVIKLDFIKPWTSTANTTIAMTPDPGGTRVQWEMVGENDFMSKAMSVFMNMDQMIGADFEKGLGRLQNVAVAAAAAMPDSATATP